MTRHLGLKAMLDAFSSSDTLLSAAKNSMILTRPVQIELNPCPATIDSSWLTAPRATIIAALIAVLGALIAYSGVLKTTRSARLQSLRAERVAVLSDASVAAQELTRSVHRLCQESNVDARIAQIALMDGGPMKELGDKYALAATRMQIYGFSTAAAKANALSDNLFAIWESLRKSPGEVIDLADSEETYDDAMTAIKTALQTML